MASYLKSFTDWLGYGTSTPEIDNSIPGLSEVVATSIPLPASPTPDVTAPVPVVGSTAAAATSTQPPTTMDWQPPQEFHVGMTKPAHWSAKKWREYQAAHGTNLHSAPGGRV